MSRRILKSFNDSGSRATEPGTPRKGVQAPRGFSIAEMLVAFAIFCTGMLVVLSVFPTSFRAMQQGRILLLGTHHARSNMEGLCRGGFSQLLVLANQQVLQTDPIQVRTDTLNVIVNGSQSAVSFQTRIWVRRVPTSLVGVYGEEYYRLPGDPNGVWRGLGAKLAAPNGNALPLGRFEMLLADKG